MDSFQHPLTIRPTDKIWRPQLMHAYLHAMKEFLLVDSGELSSPAEINDFVRTVVQKTIRRPQIQCVVHRSPGNAEMTQKDLLEHVRDLNHRVISPFGVAYCDVKERRSFLKDLIDDLKLGRKKSKKLMLKAKADGDLTKAQYYDSDQSLRKINMNSMPGGMGSAYNFLTDIAGFNSITSTGRYFIMSSYANAERFLEGNFYFPTMEHVLNYVNLMKRVCPPEEIITELVRKHQFYIPDMWDVYDFLLSNYNKYRNDRFPRWFSQWMERLKPHELVFLYYANNFKHFIQKNEDHWKAWMRNFFSYDESMITNDIPKEALFKLDEDLVIIISTVYNEWLPIVDGKKTNIYATVDTYPELAHRLACIGSRMEALIKDINGIFELFMNHHTTISNVFEHKNMYRYSVIASDTDSIIFSTKNWLQWYSGSMKINQNAYEVNSFVVYWLSKCNAFLMKTISHHRGAVDDDINGIAMKNEYFYPVMTLSDLKKHYAGLSMIQEGVVLPKMTSDIKGVQYRGSSLSGYTLQYVRHFIDSTHETIVRDGQISATDCIGKVLDFEKMVYDSLQAGNTQFLPIKPVKNEGDYANSNSSLYFNYQFWESVFAQKYGKIEIPTKCFILPLTNILDGSYLYYLQKADKRIYDALLEFTTANPKKITRIPINPLLEKIPEELIPVINIKGIVTDNCAPLYLFMKSLGISVGTTNKSRVTYSDVYAPMYTPTISTRGNQFEVTERVDGVSTPIKTSGAVA